MIGIGSTPNVPLRALSAVRALVPARRSPGVRPRLAIQKGETQMPIAQQQTAEDTQTLNAKDFRAAMAAASARDHGSFETHLRDDVTFINPMVGTVDKAGFHKFHAGLWAGLPDINYRVERTI